MRIKRYLSQAGVSIAVCGLVAQLGLVALASPTGIERVPLQIRVVENEIQLGAETSAPSYYVEYRTPDGEWHKWNSSTRIDPQINHLWFRGVFIPEDDPTEWDPGDVDVFYSSRMYGASIEDGTSWVTIGQKDPEGSTTATLPPDLMMQALMSDPLPDGDPVADPIPEPKNNQAHATPDPGTATLYWQNQTTRATFVWHLNESGLQKSGQFMRDTAAAANWSIVGVADMNGNNIKDLIWHNHVTGYALIWYLEADGYFSHSTLIRETPSHTSWRIVAVADLTNDQRPEIIWHNQSTGYVFIWYLKEDGTYDRGAFARDYPSNLSWQIDAVADVTGDGRLEFVWHNRSTGRVVIWFLQEDGTFDRVIWARPDRASALSWRIVGAADMNGDGRAELLWHNRSTGFVVIWFMTEEGTYERGIWARPDRPSALSWQIAGMADVNNNGRLEIIWYNTHTGYTFVWFMDEDTTYDYGVFARDYPSAAAWRIQSVAHQQLMLD